MVRWFNHFGAPDLKENVMSQGLTPREEQVLEQLRRGMPLKVIAIELGLHPSTISMHVGSAARKLGACGRVALVRVPQTCEPDFALLTPSERDVAKLAREGLSNAAIAELRGTSPRTVANQLARIYRKLGCGSRIGLALAS
jgi:DNA-binding CsgD family transcriptional regulator